MDISSLIDAKVYQRDTNTVLGTCRDVLLDLDAGQLSYLYVETGGWLAPSHALFSTARLSVEGKRLVLDATVEEVSERSTDETEAEGAPDPMDMPPIVVGPFGYTVSPVMAATLFDAFRARDAKVRPDPEGDSDSLQWFTHLKGLPVFDPSGFLGDVSDIIVNPTNLSCVSLKTDNNGCHGLFDFEKIRRVTQNAQSVVLKSRQPDSLLADVLDTLGTEAQRD